MKKMLYSVRVADLFELGHTRAWPWLSRMTYPWEILADLPAIIREIGEGLDPAVYERVATDVWIARSATVASTVHIGGPAIIGEGSEVRHGAFIRASALVGDLCVVGNSTELKNVILSDGVQVPHYNYVGDSILGYRAHMGAGAITSNVKSDKTPVTVRTIAAPPVGADPVGEYPIFVETGRAKLGAVLGDRVEIGCNSVLNPGCVVGAGTTVYPLSSVRGVLPADAIYKSRQGVEIVPRV